MKPVVVGAVALVAFAVGVLYLKFDPAGPSAQTMQAAPAAAGTAEPAASGAAPSPMSSSLPRATQRTDSKQALADPRLDVLKLSPDNGLIEFVRGADGRVIKEIDKDPNSPGFGKPTREYSYAGDKVVGLTAYRYLRDQVEVSTTRVAYKPDGSVDQFAQSTSYSSR